MMARRFVMIALAFCVCFAASASRARAEGIANYDTWQKSHLETLVDLYATPAVGAPSLAHAELAALLGATARSARAHGLDAETRAHLAFMRARAHAALHNEHASGA